MEAFHRSDEFLQSAKRKARAKGYNPALLSLAKTKTHKLTYQSPLGVRHFGRKGYGDHIYYSKFEPEIADQKRRVFQRSHSAISRIHNLDKFSPNELALNILW
jgi:hypothetical protein